MRKLSVVLGAAAALAMPVMVDAAPINIDLDGNFGPLGAANINTFDWLPGNALADGGNTALKTFIESGTVTPLGGGNFVVSGGTQTPFDLLYQARLTTTVDGGGANNTPGTLDKAFGGDNFEITVVAKFQEVITTVLVVGSQVTVTFDQAAVQTDNFFQVYYDSVAGGGLQADDLAGTGFNDGHLIAAGVVNIINSNFTVTDGTPTALDQFGSDNYPGLETISAGGFTNLEAVADMAFVDNNFFVDNPTALEFVLFNTNLALPFGQIDPAAMMFEGTDAATLASIGAVNGGIVLVPDGFGGFIAQIPGPNILFQADANNTFQQEVDVVVPEPATAGLAMIGLAGLLASRRRRSA